MARGTYYGPELLMCNDDRCEAGWHGCGVGREGGQLSRTFYKTNECNTAISRLPKGSYKTNLRQDETRKKLALSWCQYARIRSSLPFESLFKEAKKWRCRFHRQQQVDPKRKSLLSCVQVYELAEQSTKQTARVKVDGAEKMKIQLRAVCWCRYTPGITIICGNCGSSPLAKEEGHDFGNCARFLRGVVPVTKKGKDKRGQPRKRGKKTQLGLCVCVRACVCVCDLEWLFRGFVSECNNREVKRTYETRRVRFRWWVRERVWCWSRSDRVGPLVQTSPRPLTRTPDRVRSGTKTPSRIPNRVRSGTKTPSKHPHKYWGRLDFRGLFIFWLFFQFCTSVFFFFFDHADCGTCFLLAKNRIVIVTRHSASKSSDENAHTEVQHLPSAAFLDRFLRSRPGQLPKLKETFLHGHSILHDRLLNEREKNDIETI